jgi:glycine/D-amino acid oxidase-like deaminating enzyme
VKVFHPPTDPRIGGWYAQLPEPAPARRLNGDQRADWVVVGAGYTGLAAARRLAEQRPGERILLLEALRVGLGASGRNSGFAIDIPHSVNGATQDSHRLYRLCRAGVALLRDAVEAGQIDCQWSERGKLHCALADTGLRELDALCAELDHLGAPYERLDGAALAARIGTPYYRAAVHTPGTALMQPAALVRGLAASLPATVELYEETPVRAIEPGRPVRLATPNATITAERVLLTTNHPMMALAGLDKRLFPVSTFASLTRTLTVAEQAALGGETDWGVIPGQHMGTTLRYTRDRRLLIRNIFRYTPNFLAGEAAWRRIEAQHRRSFEARFPMLGAVPFEQNWGGALSMAQNGNGFFGPAGEGVLASLGCNGVGVGKGTIFGAMLADYAVGASSDLLDDMLALPGPSRLPPRAILNFAVPFVINRRQRVAGGDL